MKLDVWYMDRNRTTIPECPGRKYSATGGATGESRDALSPTRSTTNFVKGQMLVATVQPSNMKTDMDQEKIPSGAIR